MKKNALICFLKYPEAGHVKTRLAADLGDARAADLYSALAERVITEIYPLEGSYDVRIYTDPTHRLESYQHWLGETWSYFPQEGDDLGVRMHHAFEQTFEAGYEKALIIGTDCIGMNESFIEHTFDRLNANDFLVGPSSDGGYYLLAMKEHPPSWLFDGIQWSTELVLETTLNRMDAKEQIYEKLEEKLDIDTIEDLNTFRDSLPDEHYLSKKIDQLVLNRLRFPEPFE